MPIKCQAPDCPSNAAACITWRSPHMSASAFWYICAEHLNPMIEGLGKSFQSSKWLPGTMDPKTLMTLHLRHNSNDTQHSR